nr:response regulator [Eubacterium sp.]
MGSTIFVVDDDEMILRQAEFILGREGFVVEKYESGPRCLIALKEKKPDLILLDIEMIPMDGIATLCEIRGMQSVADVPVMFITSSLDSEREKDASGLGAVDYVIKPFIPKDLVDRVKNIVT